VAGVHDELLAAGIPVTADGDPPAVRLECARLARRMRERLVHTIGLVPAGDDVAVPAVAIELGRALAETSSSAVGVIDAHGSWPCARALILGAPADGTLFGTSWLFDNLAVLTPRIFEAGAMLGQLQSAVMEHIGVFNHLVADLTGFDHLGEQLGAVAVLDAVVVVARSGRTTMRQVQRWVHDLPDDRTLGVLLTGL
jgi:hypothetical protein